MKILKMLSQHRRDFTAIMECEFCEHIITNSNGYDDRNYHDNVIPNMICPECKKSTISEGGEIEFTETRYSDGFVI